MIHLLFTLAILSHTPNTAIRQDTLRVGSGNKAPVFDGRVTAGEYGSPALSIVAPAGEVRVWMIRHEGFVYLAAELPDSTFYWGDDLVVSLDPDGSGGQSPSLGDRQWYLRRTIDSSFVATVTSEFRGWIDPAKRPATLGHVRGERDWGVASVSTEAGWTLELRIREDAYSTGGELPRLAIRTFNDDPQGWWSWPLPPEGLPAERVEYSPFLWAKVELR